jgi:platelet-activating factor acetylhydrolase IB subunit alpha
MQKKVLSFTLRQLTYQWLFPKIMDLEARLQEALHDNSNMAALPPGFSRRNNPDWLPTAGSSKHTLTGHRDAVNAVAFHPVYSVLVSASDDSTMKVWDWETGEMERTLKGHTKRITDCEYDSKGKNLGMFALPRMQSTAFMTSHSILCI